MSPDIITTVNLDNFTPHAVYQQGDYIVRAESGISPRLQVVNFKTQQSKNYKLNFTEGGYPYPIAISLDASEIYYNNGYIVNLKSGEVKYIYSNTVGLERLAAIGTDSHGEKVFIWQKRTDDGTQYFAGDPIKTFGEFYSFSGVASNPLFNFVGLVLGSIIIDFGDEGIHCIDALETKTYTVTTSCNPSDAGTTKGDGIYNAGESVMVMATANAEYTFTNWTEAGSVVSVDASYTFVINADRNLIANFTEISTPTPPVVTPDPEPEPEPVIIPTAEPEPVRLIEPQKVILGTVEGVVKMRSGKPLANTRIELHSNPTSTVTDQNGNFKFENVPLGQHEIYIADLKVSDEKILLKSIEVNQKGNVYQVAYKAGPIKTANIELDEANLNETVAMVVDYEIPVPDKPADKQTHFPWWILLLLLIPVILRRRKKHTEDDEPKIEV